MCRYTDWQAHACGSHRDLQELNVLKRSRGNLTLHCRKDSVFLRHKTMKDIVRNRYSFNFCSFLLIILSHENSFTLSPVNCKLHILSLSLQLTLVDIMWNVHSETTQKSRFMVVKASLQSNPLFQRQDFSNNREQPDGFYWELLHNVVEKEIYAMHRRFHSSKSVATKKWQKLSI